MTVMTPDFKTAFITGTERVAAWSDLLDDINVFPVADGDTGRNLLVSLIPLRELNHNPDTVIQKLQFSARGNSGIIAARFLTGFLPADSMAAIPECARAGRDLAWTSVSDPKHGTMLTVFDALADILRQTRIGPDGHWASVVIDHLKNSVLSTTERLPRLAEAGVVDSGALGMFIYLEGFLNALVGRTDSFLPLFTVFKNRLTIANGFHEGGHKQYCIDTVIRPGENIEENLKHLAENEESVVISPKDDFLKIHLHTDDKELAKQKIASFGAMVQWSHEDIDAQVSKTRAVMKKQAVHIMTDAAGSVTREDTESLGMTVLNSYITAGDTSLPETFFTPSELYHIMQSGTKASTSQASEFERHQNYQKVLNFHENIVYLCVGSFYTGNFDVARAWQKEHDPENRFTVIDTGTASGRLGLLAISTARYAATTDNPAGVIAFAHDALEKSREYIFIDRLKYLAKGGRMSKTGAFFGDMLNMKPVITPDPDGAKKIGMVRNRQDQLTFLLEKLSSELDNQTTAAIMLEYTDNRSWVTDVVNAELSRLYPRADILVRPLSLTTGVHTGPGTWGVAFIPSI